MRLKLEQIFLLSLALLLGYAFLIPPFDPPDEQSHLAQVHFFVNKGRMPNLSDQKTLSEEATFAESVIGTLHGDNKYFFHPEYKYEMSDHFEGPFEEELRKLNNVESKSTYTIWQTSTYPPLYYWATSLIYRFTYNFDFFTRLYTSRIISVLITAGLSVIAFLLGKLIFENNSKAMILSAMVILFPMTSYLGVGINSDNLHFLLFTISCYLYLKLINKGWSSRLSLAIGLVIGLDLITKPQAYILFPLGILAVIVRWRWSEWRLWPKHIAYILIPILAIAGWQELPKLLLGSESVSATSYVARSINYGGFDNFKHYLTSYMSTHFKEIIVWYWGVFKWSGIILPRPLWWIANRLILISSIGLFITLIRDIKKRVFTWKTQVIVFSIFANMIYIASIFWFDWQFFQEYGRSLGLQARYYVPLLSLQMSLLYMGLLGLVKTARFQSYIGVTLVIFFAILNIVGLYSLLSSYYQLSPLSTFITQISQYKPDYAKGSWWYLWIMMYLSGISGILISSIRRTQSE